MENIKYLLLFLIPLLFIFPYGKFRCNNKNFKDPLENKILFELDGWSMTHYLFFMLVGFIYPQKFIITMIIGIIWELFEHFYGKNRPGWLGGYGDCNNLATDKISGNWWYGKWSDILCNSAGFITGAFLKNKFF